MPPKPNRPPLQPKHNRLNAPNAGQAAKDRGEKPTDSYRLAKNVKMKNPMPAMMKIGKDTQTFIQYDGRFDFLFWGSPKNVEHAKSLLQTHILQDNPTFQHHGGAAGPSRDAPFEAMGSFLWPSDEYSPVKELGQVNFERLNPIRKENNCFIEYDDSRSSFVVKGSAENVPEALSRIKGLLCRVVAQSSPVQRLYLIQNDCDKVKMASHALSAIHQFGSVQQTRVRQTVKSIGARPGGTDVSLIARQMKDRVMQTLRRVQWHQGHIDLRVHLGTLTLQNFQAFEERTLSEYREMISDSYNFRANITEELGDKMLEDSLLPRFLNATSLLEPHDRFTSHVADTKPEYSASIKIDIKDGRGDVVITKRWHEDSGHFRHSNPDYQRIDERSGRIKFLEVYMSDTLTDLTWLLDISALGTQDASHLPKWVQEHGEYYVQMDVEKARNAKSFCVFESYNGIPRPLAHKRAIKEKIIWKFDMKPPYIDYEVEVAKVFVKEYTPGSIPGREAVTCYEERWTVDVKHRNWATSFAHNHNLQSGKSADWKANIETWFPVASDDMDEKRKGHVQLLMVLQHVQDIVLGKVD